MNEIILELIIIGLEIAIIIVQTIKGKYGIDDYEEQADERENET